MGNGCEIANPVFRYSLTFVDDPRLVLPSFITFDSQALTIKLNP
jgi:hypothetical protein